MRIVTGHATDPRVAAVPPAVEDSIRLISQVVLTALLWHEQGLFKTYVASTADFLTQLVRFQLRRIKYLQIFIVCLDGRNMFFTRPMTTLTGNSGHQMIEL